MREFGVMNISENRTARYDYALQEDFEAGIMLTGPEVKSLRLGRCSIGESYVDVENGEAFLINAHIDALENQDLSTREDYSPRRKRKLLLHKKEIANIQSEITRGGMTAVALRIYFNARGIVKVKIALAKGKNARDKRDTIKDRDWGREKARILKNGRA